MLIMKNTITMIDVQERSRWDGLLPNINDSQIFAGDINHNQDQDLPLPFLFQVLNGISKEHNSTVVLPIPKSILRQDIHLMMIDDECDSDLYDGNFNHGKYILLNRKWIQWLTEFEITGILGAKSQKET